MWLGKFVLCVLVFASVNADQEVQLEIPQGHLKGLRLETVYHNQPYYSFKGIPYAKPNVGPNKFKISEPADNWEGVYDATYYRSDCPFYCMIAQGLMGEDDCLHLNVYTPTLDKDARKAVMVYIHPGLFTGGTVKDVLFGPDFLVEQDVILVTINYRVGVYGFLNTEDKAAPGNAGLKDQVLALKWVKDNIHFFGGCPDRVTIFGQDAGGSSVQFHMMSPMSEGLFSAAIQESGAAFNPWSLTYEPRKLAFMLGETLGIQTTDSQELVEKLAKFDAMDIINASFEVFKKQAALNGRMAAFVPSIEVDVGEDMFLPADPWILLKSGKMADVPLMVGLVSEEAAILTKMFIDQIDMVNEQPEMFLPCNLNITDANRKKELGQSLKQFYFGEKRASIESVNEYTKMLSDIIFDAGVLVPLDLITKQRSSPIYEYEFAYLDTFGLMKTLFEMPEVGVTHGDEVLYMFFSNLFKNLPEPGSSADKMTRIVTKLWTNFAKNKDPTSEKNDLITLTWEPRGTDDNYMIINEQLKMDKNFMKDRMEFWRSLYKDVLAN